VRALLLASPFILFTMACFLFSLFFLAARGTLAFIPPLMCSLSGLTCLRERHAGIQNRTHSTAHPICLSRELEAWASVHANKSLRFWADKRPDTVYAANIPAHYFQMLPRVGVNRQKLVLMRLINGQVVSHMSNGSHGKRDAFTDNVVKSLVAALRRIQRAGWVAPNTSFVLSSHAAMDQYPPRLAEHVPIFTACMRTHGQCPDRGILLPRPYKIFANDKPLRQDPGLRNVSWSQKRGLAIFRGALSSFMRVPLLLRAARSIRADIACTLLPQGFVRPLDLELAMMGGLPAASHKAETQPTSGDACLVERQWQPNGPERWSQAFALPNCTKNNRISMAQQQLFRYLIVPNGVGCADRLKQLLSSSSIVLLQDSELSEFWQRDIQPYRHYLPVAPDFANLESQIEWAEQRPHEMRAMVARNNAYAAKYLTSRAQLCYIAVLLEKYAALFPPSKYSSQRSR